jgi:SAM-dependent methyltransferase
LKSASDVMDSLVFLPRDCPVCGLPASNGEPFLDRRIDSEKLSAFSYASRKTPEYMCYTLVRCPGCDVVYANESPSAVEIENAYHEAAYDSKEEAVHAAESYERALRHTISTMIDRKGALDIGTGTGIFLKYLQTHGFTGLVGVEPSQAAIEAADDDIQSFIREGLFLPSDFASGSFSLITCFMTLEHVSDPSSLVRDCLALLKPGGVMAVVVHDQRAWNNRLLGARAPIIDIEHLQLFSKASVAELFRRSGFVDIESSSFWNSYRLTYWNRLFPTPVFLKRILEKLLGITGLGNAKLSMNVGNLMVVARKPI